MYVSCCDCDWEQDDFYSEQGYNPCSFLKDFFRNDSDLFKNPDKEVDICTYGGKCEKGTEREFVARYFEQYARRIRGMKWITYEQFLKDKKAGKAICPKCGSKNLVLD